MIGARFKRRQGLLAERIGTVTADSPGFRPVCFSNQWLEFWFYALKGRIAAYARGRQKCAKAYIPPFRKYVQ